MPTMDDGNGLCFPYDVLLEILRRLPVPALARSQSVCRAWRRAIAVDLRLQDLFFPKHGFPGIFLSKVGCRSSSAFFAPPSSHKQQQQPHPPFRRPVFRHDWARVEHCSDGLLLLDVKERWAGRYHVCNPATARCAPLPRPPLPSMYDVEAAYLAFDPAVSLHYHVFLLHTIRQEAWIDLVDQVFLPRLFGEEEEPGSDELELLPTTKESREKAVVPSLVFSSRTGRWENREFTPGRRAPRRLYDAAVMWPRWYKEALYWRGSLYVHCYTDVLMILRTLEATYDMVKLPGEPCQHKSVLLASYERGIRCAAIKELRLLVWMLIESADGHLGWTLAHEADLNPYGHAIYPLAIQPRVTWGLVRTSDQLASLFESGYNVENDQIGDDDNDGVEEEDGDEEEELSDKDGSEHSWNSDEDNFIDVGVHLEPPEWGQYSRIIGFHPHKDALLLTCNYALVAYHLDTSRMQYLGDTAGLTKDRGPEIGVRYVDGWFPYRPCYVDVLPAGKLSSSSSY